MNKSYLIPSISCLLLVPTQRCSGELRDPYRAFTCTLISNDNDPRQREATCINAKAGKLVNTLYQSLDTLTEDIEGVWWGCGASGWNVVGGIVGGIIDGIVSHGGGRGRLRLRRGDRRLAIHEICNVHVDVNINLLNALSFDRGHITVCRTEDTVVGCVDGWSK